MPEPLPKPAACVFDLDGTLVDSLRDIADSLNEGLQLLGLPTYPVGQCRFMVGDTPTDVATAHAAGAVPIGVTWGFRSRGDLQAAGALRIVDHPDELP